MPPYCIMGKIVEKPAKAKRSYIQKLVASASKVFPLLCPVRELEWVPGWSLDAAFSESGVAEEDCVFVTCEEKNKATWMITRHEPSNFFVEMVKILPDQTASKLRILLTDTGSNSCDALVSYTHVATSEKGKEFVESFTQDYYETFMKSWETELNKFLKSHPN